jgi:hypothetical protein
MKRASYRDGVAWIAHNDEPLSVDREEIEGFISTLLLADLFHVEASRVADDVLRLKEKEVCDEAFGRSRDRARSR